jgi:hypothetical protein
MDKQKEATKCIYNHYQQAHEKYKFCTDANHGYKTTSGRDLMDDKFTPIISAVWVFMVNFTLSGCLTPKEVIA